jgi:hypothetical protein
MMGRASAQVIPLLLALGCGPGERNYYEQGDQGIKDLDSGPHPSIRVDPESIDFGAVAQDDDDEHVTVVTVTNEGEADLHIQNIELDDPGLPFTITSIQSVLVAPDNSTEFEVIFRPASVGSWQGLVFLETDDPDLPLAEILLLGEAVTGSGI